MGDGVFEVLSTAGDTHLGGDDFDKRIVDFLADDFKKNEGIDLRKDRQACRRLLLSCHAICLCGWQAVVYVAHCWCMACDCAILTTCDTRTRKQLQRIGGVGHVLHCTASVATFCSVSAVLPSLHVRTR